MSTDQPLVTVATFSSVGEAEVARITLEADGIACFLADAEAVNMLWYASSAIGGVKLQVAARDARAAERLLGSRMRRMRDRAVDDYGLQRMSPGGQAQDDEPAEHKDAAPGGPDALVNNAWRAAVFGLILCPPILHLYSLWLLLQAMSLEQQVSEPLRGKMLATIVIDLAAIFLMAGLWPMWKLLLT